MPRFRPLPILLCAALLTAGIAGCGGDDGPTTTSATTDAALVAQGARGGTATGTAPVPSTGSPLGEYAQGAEAASPSRAAPVRDGFRAFAQAVLDRDAAEACSHVVGFEELLRARGQQGTCETLLPAIGNTSAGPSARDVQLIDDADVLVAGDRATISVGSAAPVPMRRAGGSWKLDYAAFAAAPKGR